MLYYIIQSKDPNSMRWTDWCNMHDKTATFKTICMDYPNHEVRLVSAVENPDFNKLTYQEMTDNPESRYIVYEVINYRPARS